MPYNNFYSYSWFINQINIIFLQSLHNHNNGTLEGEDVEVAGVPAGGEHDGEEHDFGDVMIHQVNLN